MKTRLPTRQEIRELVAYLPRLYRKGFKPIKRWHGGRFRDGHWAEMIERGHIRRLLERLAEIN